MKFKDLRIKNKLFAASGILLVVALLVVFVFVNIQLDAVKKAEIAKTRKLMTGAFHNALNAKKDTWLTNALQIAFNTNIVEALAAEDRGKTIDILENYGRIFKENTNFNNVAIHIIDSKLHSFVKSWDSSSYGENLRYSDAFRKIKETRKPLITMEEASKGLRLKGLFPILKNGEFMGIADFEGGLNSIKRTLKPGDIEFLYFMDEQYLDAAPKLKSKPSFKNYYLSQKDVDKTFLDHVLHELDFEKAQERGAFDNKYFTVALPVKDFSGEKLGVFILGKKSELVTETINASASTTYQVIGFLSAIILVLIASMITIMTVYVTRPLGRLVDTMKDIAQGEGDLTVRIHTDSKDEIGELGNWFNVFIQKLNSIMMNVMDTTKNLDASSNDVSGISDQIALDAEKVSAQATTVATAAEEMSNNMNSVAAAMEEASLNVNQVASAAEEMTTTINEISSNTGKTGSITDQAVAEAKDASKKMSELGVSAKDIGKVTETIQDISEQTNLLALNATIEAARAGEAGKGFAVVAGEIKALAGQTAEATVDIRQRIEDVQSITQNSVESINRVTKIIDDVNELVSSVATAVEEQTATTGEIAENVTQASSGLSDVNENVAQASTAADEIAKDIAFVDQISTAMTGNGAQMTESASGLNELAQKMSALTDQFKLNKDGRFYASSVKLAHSAWKKKLSDMLTGKISLSPSEITDHHTCEFGKWYRGEGRDKYGQKETFKAIGPRHEKVHETARQIAELFQEDKKEDARILFSDFKDITNDLFALLDQLETEINQSE